MFLFGCINEERGCGFWVECHTGLGDFPPIRDAAGGRRDEGIGRLVVIAARHADGNPRCEAPDRLAERPGLSKRCAWGRMRSHALKLWRFKF